MKDDIERNVTTEGDRPPDGGESLELARSKKKEKKQREKEEGQSTPAGPRVFLIRHADASEGPRDPDRGGHLTPLGQRQADVLARRLANWQIDAIVCSDMYRAQETAEAVHAYHPGVPLLVDPDFRELSTGKLEAFERGELEVDLPARLESAWQKLVTLPWGVTVLITHNGLIKYLLGRTLKYEASLKPRFHSAQTGITALQVKSKGRALLQFFNDTRHLTPDLAPQKTPWIEDMVTGRWHFGSGEDEDQAEPVEPPAERARPSRRSPSMR